MRQKIVFRSASNDMDSASIDLLTDMLKRASFLGNLAVVTYLIAGGALANGPVVLTQNTETPLNAASRKGHLDIVRFLILKGASVRRLNTTNPLFTAASNGHRDIVDFLLENTAAHVNRETVVEDDGNVGMTPLNGAIKSSHFDVVRRLLQDKRIDVNIPNPYNGASPLYSLCSMEGSPDDVVKLLIENNANVNFHVGYQFPLHEVVKKGRLEIAEILLDKGANVDADNYERTPLQLATLHSDLPMVCLLLNKGADVNKIGTYSSSTPLHVVETPDITRVLLKHRALVNATNNFNSTPLHMQVSTLAEAKNTNKPNEKITTCKEIIRLLVDAGANFEALNAYNHTPLRSFQGKVIQQDEEMNQLFMEKEGTSMEQRRKRWLFLKVARCIRVVVLVDYWFKLMYQPGGVRERAYAPGGIGFSQAQQEFIRARDDFYTHIETYENGNDHQMNKRKRTE